VMCILRIRRSFGLPGLHVFFLTPSTPLRRVSPPNLHEGFVSLGFDFPAPFYAPCGFFPSMRLLKYEVPLSPLSRESSVRFADSAVSPPRHLASARERVVRLWFELFHPPCPLAFCPSLVVCALFPIYRAAPSSFWPAACEVSFEGKEQRSRGLSSDAMLALFVCVRRKEFPQALAPPLISEGSRVTLFLDPFIGDISGRRST